MSGGTVFGGEGNDTIWDAYGSGQSNGTTPATLSGGEGADEFSFENSGDVTAAYSVGPVGTMTFTVIADFTRGTDLDLPVFDLHIDTDASP